MLHLVAFARNRVPGQPGKRLRTTMFDQQQKKGYQTIAGGMGSILGPFYFKEAREAYPIQVKGLSEVEPGLSRIEPNSYLNELQPTQT